MARFICKRCKYSFELKAERAPRQCPYCGAENTVQKERSAEELLKDVEE